MALGVLLIGVGALVMSRLATIGALAPALAVGGFGLIMVAVRRRSARLGWANGVTLARLVGTSWIAALTCTWLVVGVDGAGVVALVAIAVRVAWVKPWLSTARR